MMGMHGMWVGTLLQMVTSSDLETFAGVPVSGQIERHLQDPDLSRYDE